MEHIEGQSLDELLNDAPLAPREAARIIRDIAKALEYAHNRDIVHRDIKPSNILVDRSGTAKLVDFGLAKSLIDDPSLTKTGEIIGTACYMPPEQASGSMRNVDQRSDIYSLGTVLYELIAGRPPFAGDTVLAVIKQVEEATPIPPTKISDSISRDLETICMKAMAKEKDRRYASATDFACDLDNYLTGAPIMARRSGVIYRALNWSRRHPAVSTATFMACLALLVIGAIFLWRRPSPPTIPDPAPTNENREKARSHVEAARHEINKASRYTAEARKERRKVLEKAVAELNEALRLDSEYADAYYFRAVAYRALAKTALARTDLDNAVRIDPEHADAVYDVILLRIRSFRDRMVRAQFGSDTTNELLQRQVAEIEQAIEKLKRLAVKPEKALIAEAKFAQTFRKRKKALSLANQAIKENRAFADAYIIRASIRREVATRAMNRDMKLLELARKDCDDAILSEVNNAEAYRVRAEIFIALDRYDDAIRDLQEMEFIAPDEPQTYLDRALVLEQDRFPARSIDRIRTDLDRALKLAPKNPTARFRRALLYLNSALWDSPKEKFHRARRDLDVGLEADPDFVAALVFRMVCHTALGDEVGLRKDVEKFRTLNTHLNEKAMERRLRRLRSLIRFFIQQITVSRTKALVREANALLQAKKYRKAEKLYREILARLDDPQIDAKEGLGPQRKKEIRTVSRYNLACLYSLQGDADRGIEELERALQAGFSNFNHLLQDSDLENVRKHPGFSNLIERFRK